MFFQSAIQLQRAQEIVLTRSHFYNFPDSWCLYGANFHLMQAKTEYNLIPVNIMCHFIYKVRFLYFCSAWPGEYETLLSGCHIFAELRTNSTLLPWLCRILTLFTLSRDLLLPAQSPTVLCKWKCDLFDSFLIMNAKESKYYQKYPLQNIFT